MLAVYIYCLGNLFIIDKAANTMFTAYAGSVIHDADYEQKVRLKSRKITNATVNKHKKGDFVISFPLQNEYAPEEIPECYKKNGFIKDYIGHFEVWEDLRQFLLSAYKRTIPYFEQHISSNRWSDILDGIVLSVRGLTDRERETQAKHLANKDDLFHAQAKAQVFMDELLEGLTADYKDSPCISPTAPESKL